MIAAAKIESEQDARFGSSLQGEQGEGATSRETEESGNRLPPPYILKALDVLHSIGMSPHSDMWRTVITVLGISALIFMPAAATSIALGHFRYALPSFIGALANASDMVNVPAMVRASPDLSPWVHIPRHNSWQALIDPFLSNATVAAVWGAIMIATNISFVHDEVKRRGIEAPGPAFYVMVVCGAIGFICFILMSTFSFEFISGAIIHEQKEFLVRLKNRELSFADAMRIHRTHHRRHRKAIASMSTFMDYSTTMYMLLQMVFLLDYFVTPWSHWYMVVSFILMALTISFVFPGPWAEVNYNQDQLKVLVAESADDEDYFMDDAKNNYNEDEGVGVGVRKKTMLEKVKDNDKDVEAGEHEPGELWNAQLRTQFLVYLNNYELKTSFFSFEVGPEFSLQTMFFLLSAAFVFWQTTQLSKWTGFSFDKALS